MHGGAKGSGAPEGNQNALKHGLYAKRFTDLIDEAKAAKKEARALLKQLK